MDRQELRRWVADNSDGTLATAEINHVAMCCEHLQEWYHEDRPLGSFLTAVVSNDFVIACLRADDMNIKALRIYALYLHWELPGDWMKKAKGVKNGI